MYGRIERFEGTDANRLDASDDEQRRRLFARPGRVAGSDAAPGVTADARDVWQADEGVDEPPRPAPR